MMNLDTMIKAVERLGNGREMLEYLATFKNSQYEEMSWDAIPDEVNLTAKDYADLGCENDLMVKIHDKLNRKGKNIWEDEVLEMDLKHFIHTVSEDTLKYMYQNYGISCQEAGAEDSAIAGRIDLLNFFFKEGFKFTSRIMYTAVEKANIEVIKWLNRRGAVLYDSHCMHIATERGDLDIIRHISHELVSPMRLFEVSAENQRLDVLEWLWNENPSFCERYFGSSFYLSDLVDEENYEVIKWLCKNKGAKFESFHLNLLIEKEEFEKFNVLQALDLIDYSSLLNEAALSGNIKVVKWLCENVSRELLKIEKVLEEGRKLRNNDTIKYLSEITV